MGSKVDTAGLNKLIQDKGPGDVIPLVEVIPLISAKSFVIVYVGEGLDKVPDVEAVILSVEPDAVIKHATGERRTEGNYSADIKIEYVSSGVTKDDLFLADLVLVVNEKQKVRNLRCIHLPSSVGFSL